MVCDDNSATGNQKERRAATRAPIELKVEYQRVNTFLADYTKNISRGGTFIKTAKPLPIGTAFVFQLVIPPLAEPLELHGEVTRVVDAAMAEQAGGEPGMGIRFVYQSDETRTHVEAVVAQLMADALGQRLSQKLLSHLRTRGE